MTDGTTIIRAAPRARRIAGGFALALPSVRTLTLPIWHEARVTMRAYPGTLLGLTLAGALFWPLTLAGSR